MCVESNEVITDDDKKARQVFELGVGKQHGAVAKMATECRGKLTAVLVTLSGVGVEDTGRGGLHGSVILRETSKMTTKILASKNARSVKNVRLCPDPQQLLGLQFHFGRKVLGLEQKNPMNSFHLTKLCY